MLVANDIVTPFAERERAAGSQAARFNPVACHAMSSVVVCEIPMWNSNGFDNGELADPLKVWLLILANAASTCRMPMPRSAIAACVACAQTDASHASGGNNGWGRANKAVDPEPEPELFDPEPPISCGIVGDRQPDRRSCGHSSKCLMDCRCLCMTLCDNCDTLFSSGAGGFKLHQSMLTCVFSRTFARGRGLI